MPPLIRPLASLLCAMAFGLPFIAKADVLTLNNDIVTVATLTGTAATLDGKAELHLTGTGDPLTGSVVNLTSPDAWLFLDNIAPSAVASTFLGRVQVNGAAATLNNVRIVQYDSGAVVIPQSPGFSGMTVYGGQSYSGASMSLQSYVAYNDASLGTMKKAIRSFRLKRGYMATVAQAENGTGVSQTFVAQDGDLEVGALPGALDRNIRFVRVFPWRWTNKKGIAGDITGSVKPSWWYNWNISQATKPDMEYVPIRQTRWWPGLDQDWKARGSNHLLGYNEPDHADQANLAVGDAIWSWPDLLGTGLRVGAPAVSDGGLNWLYSFIDQADAANLRVDFVPVHYYRSYWNAADPDGATTQFYNFLKGIHDRVKRPLWVTEFNNGANWTGDPDPTYAQQKATVAKMIAMLDSTPWVERYAIYNWVEDVRRVQWDDGSLTDAGVVYRDDASTLAYHQELPFGTDAGASQFSFDGDAHEASGSGHDAMLVGTPTFAAGKSGQAITLDGAYDYLQVSPQLSNCTDFTFAGWIKWDGGTNWQRVFDYGAGTNAYMFLSPRSGAGTLRFVINSGGGEQQLNAPALTAGQWTHVAVTLSGNTGKLFVNGSLANSNASMTVNPADVGAVFNYLGKSQFATDALFKGQLDDLRFLPTALTDSQIASLANGAPLAFNANPLVLPSAVMQWGYAETLAGGVSGAIGVMAFLKESGPDWLTVSGDGLLSGTPALSDVGVSRFVVSVRDATGAFSRTTLQITVINASSPAPVISSPLTASVRAGTAFGYQITASPAPAAYAAAGLPQGLVIDTVKGLISGTPTVEGAFPVMLSATNSGGTGTATLTLTVLPALPSAPVITSPASAAVVAGQPFSYQIAASNNPASFVASRLPSGLGLDSATGVISGTTTVLGTHAITIGATNDGGTGTATLALAVTAVPLPLPVITSAAAADASVGAPFTYQIAASNAPASYAATGLPEGLSVDAKSGLITGTPALAGTFSVSLSATNSGGTGTATLTLTVTDAPVVTVAVAVAQAPVGGQPAQITLTRTGGDPGQTLVVRYTLKGSATNGTDYKLLSGKKKFKPGKLTRSIKIYGLGDLGGAVKKTLKITVVPGDGYTVGSPSSVRVKILSAP